MAQGLVRDASKEVSGREGLQAAVRCDATLRDMLCKGCATATWLFSVELIRSLQNWNKQVPFISYRSNEARAKCMISKVSVCESRMEHI